MKGCPLYLEFKKQVINFPERDTSDVMNINKRPLTVKKKKKKQVINSI